MIMLNKPPEFKCRNSSPWVLLNENIDRLNFSYFIFEANLHFLPLYNHNTYTLHVICTTHKSIYKKNRLMLFKIKRMITEKSQQNYFLKLNDKLNEWDMVLKIIIISVLFLQFEDKCDQFNYLSN